MSKHVSVLLNECIENLNLKEDSVIVDCTLGYGGHSSEILKRINKGYLFAFDQDNEAILSSTKRLNEINNNYEIINSNFVNIKEELLKFTIGTNYNQCTGCGLCAGICPGKKGEKALTMVNANEAKTKEYKEKNN